MDLITKQCKEKNKLALQVTMVCFVYMQLAMLILAFTCHFEPKRIVQSLSVTAGIITLVMSYSKYKEQELFMKIDLITYTIVYAMILFCGDSLDAYIYILPAFFLTIVYGNKRYVKWGSISVIIINLLDIVQYLNTFGVSGEGNDVFFIRIIILLIALYSSTKAVKLTQQFHKEEIGLIEEKSREQRETMLSNMELASEVTKYFEDSNKQIVELNRSINISSNSIEEIAASCESTAEAIQKQNAMTYEIEENVKRADEEIKEILQSSRKSKELIVSGAELIAHLKENTEDVKTTSNAAKKSFKNLVEQINKVEEITDTILNISSQTNLLALNASIEAARAGEYGKGFSVVAEEIRKLSDETKTATSRITDIMTTLMQDANVASESIKKSVDSVEKQNELMDVTGERFVGIGAEMERLHRAIGNMGNNMQGIVVSTEEIASNISQLSATTEEVAASSQNGIEHGENSKKAVEEVNAILSKIYQVSKRLEQID